MSAEVMDSHKDFHPAAGHDLFLPLYDPFVGWLGFDRVREDLIAQANVESAHHVLDIGCGTGTLLMQLKRRYPQAHLFGLDPDPKALRRARMKAERAAVPINFEQGFADKLPYETASFDRVFSSFMFHHLEDDSREKTLREVLRVLRPGGSFHLVDFVNDNRPHGFLRRFINSHAHLKDNSDERILQVMNRAGFKHAEKVKADSMLMGLLETSSYKGHR